VYYSIEFIYDKMIQDILSGNLKVDTLKYYEFPRDIKEFEENDQRLRDKGELDAGCEFLNIAIDIVEKTINIPIRLEYAFPGNAVRCGVCNLRKFTSGSLNYYTKSNEKALKKELNKLHEFGIISHITKLTAYQLEKKPGKYKRINDDIVEYRTTKEYIDECIKEN
jgi:hypothetical protein